MRMKFAVLLMLVMAIFILAIPARATPSCSENDAACNIFCYWAGPGEGGSGFHCDSQEEALDILSWTCVGPFLDGDDYLYLGEWYACCCYDYPD